MTKILVSAAVCSAAHNGAPVARPGWMITASAPSWPQGLSVFTGTAPAAAGAGISGTAVAGRPADAVADHASRLRETKQPYPGPPRDQLQT